MLGSGDSRTPLLTSAFNYDRYIRNIIRKELKKEK